MNANDGRSCVCPSFCCCRRRFFCSGCTNRSTNVFVPCCMPEPSVQHPPHHGSQQRSSRGTTNNNKNNNNIPTAEAASIAVDGGGGGGGYREAAIGSERLRNNRTTWAAFECREYRPLRILLWNKEIKLSLPRGYHHQASGHRFPRPCALHCDTSSLGRPQPPTTTTLSKSL